MKDYQRLTISLTPEEARALWTDAERGGRIPREQVRFLLRIALGLDEVPPENISQASLLTLRQDVDEFWKIIPDMLARLDKLENGVLSVGELRKLMDEIT